MDLKDIKGIGDKTASLLERSGITTIASLLTTYPRTYRKYLAKTTSTANVGEWVVLEGRISNVTSKRLRGLTVTKANFTDSKGTLNLSWFNQPYLKNSLRGDVLYLVMGQVGTFNSYPQITSPLVRASSEQVKREDLLVPIYSQRRGLKPSVLRAKIKSALLALGDLPDPLPTSLVSRYHLTTYTYALHEIHEPKDEASLEQAIHRLAWQELYDLQLKNQKDGKDQQNAPGITLNITKVSLQKFLENLPFTLTKSQRSVIEEMLQDLKSGKAMNRLLQGEVGSGKTVVAATLAYLVAKNGYKTLIMAPTQILASQLFDTITKLLSPWGVQVSLVTSATKTRTPSEVIVGTHALLNQKYAGVGLVIIDEQHRFGVEAREQLAKGGGTAPHLLMMTATPIPRTLAMTLLSRLTLSHLKGLPAGRLPTKSYLVPDSRRQASYVWIEKLIGQGNQVFVVTPLIEKSEEEDSNALKSIKEYKELLSKYFPHRRLDVLHGRLSPKEKLSAFTRFAKGQTDIMVATSIVEVGLDVPSANLIVIEDAERYGLSQLHQLRGRVGRGGGQGYCLLFTESKSQKVQTRLRYFLNTTDGAKLAEYDLKSRGAGEIFGASQHGFFNLSLGNIWDEQMLKETAEAALSCQKPSLPLK